MEAASRAEGSSPEHTSGQGTTAPSPSATNSSTESLLNAIYGPSPSRSGQLESGVDTPQSSVVNIIFPQAAQPNRAARFVECSCLSGGPCVGTGGLATCGCGSSPEAPRKAMKRSVKGLVKAVTRGVKRAWNRRIQAIKERAGRVL